MREWLQQYVKAFGPLPRDYIVIDLETTGRDPKVDLILQIGWAEVRGCQVVENDTAEILIKIFRVACMMNTMIRWGIEYKVKEAKLLYFFCMN